MISGIKERFWKNIFRTRATFSENVCDKGEIVFPISLDEKLIAGLDSADLSIVIKEITVLRNGSTTEWLPEEHQEGEEICLMCDKCGWLSLPILIFREYFHFSSFGLNLSEEKRSLAKTHLLEVFGGKVRGTCPHCKRDLVAVLDFRREKQRHPE